MMWLPIESAPKDGIPIIVLDYQFAEPQCKIAKWWDGELEDENGKIVRGAWLDYLDDVNDLQTAAWPIEMPLFWLPLPKLPDLTVKQAKKVNRLQGEISKVFKTLRAEGLI